MQAKADYEGKPLITKDERCEIELGLLEKFDAFARENGLTYWLFWGTLLGAVRHKGFIPCCGKSKCTRQSGMLGPV